MKRLRAVALACLLAAALGAKGEEREPGAAEASGIRVEDGYILASAPSARAAAAYMAITNATDVPDRLIGAATDAAARSALHAHVLEDGIARMVEMEAGIELPAGATVTLARGGLHVMLMGLAAPLAEGASVEVTLVFETAGPLAVTLPVEAASAGAAAPEHEH